MAELFDIVAVRIDTRRVRVMDEGQDRRNAEAYVTFAVMRRGVEMEIFSVVPAGSYKEGDQWTGNKMEEKKRPILFLPRGILQREHEKERERA